MNKFGAVKTEVNGIKFDSKKEAGRWRELQLLELAGEIRRLRRQVKIELVGKCGQLRTRTGRPMKMTVDFAYEDKRLGWGEVYEDSKGYATRDYEVRKAVVEAMGLKIVET